MSKISAHVFMNLSTDTDDGNILDRVANIDEVIEAYRLYGTYDLVLYIEAEDTQHLKEITLESIRQLEFIQSTMTMISLESHINE